MVGVLDCVMLGSRPSCGWLLSPKQRICADVPDSWLTSNMQVWLKPVTAGPGMSPPSGNLRSESARQRSRHDQARRDRRRPSNTRRSYQAPAQTCFGPTEMRATAPRPGISSGFGSLAPASPRPSWPNWFAPQHATESTDASLTRTAHATDSLFVVKSSGPPTLTPSANFGSGTLHHAAR